MPLDVTQAATPTQAQQQAAAGVERAEQPALDPRTRRLLEGSIAATLLRLAAPNVLVMVVQSSVQLIETYFVGRLGTDALAGMALVFPVVMLMQMMSAGAIGNGIAAAVARALGAGRRSDADRLVLHALTVAFVCGLFFSAAVLGGGPFLYAAMGGSGESLRAALTYSDIVFAGMVLVWSFNALANVLRGSGNMIVPAAVSCIGTLVLLPLSPALILGWGPFPRLGIAGGAVSFLLFYAAGNMALALYLLAGRSVVRPRLRGRLEWRLFHDILRVGAVSALITLQTNLTIGITTGLVGSFGAASIAGYGIGTRLEYLLVPLIFGFGAPLVAMVGTNIGAGNSARALRSAWIGTAIAFALAETIGLCAAAFPHAWLSLFDSDPAMLAVGSLYLQTVGPFYGLFGVGLALNFASQGAGQMRWPLLAALSRLLVAAGGGYLALRWTGGLFGVFAALSLALAGFGLVNAAAVAGGAWFGPLCLAAIFRPRLHLSAVPPKPLPIEP